MSASEPVLLLDHPPRAVVPGAPSQEHAREHVGPVELTSDGHTTRNLPKASGGKPIAGEKAGKEPAAKARLRRKSLKIGWTRKRRKPTQERTEGLAQRDDAQNESRRRKAVTDFDFDNADPRRILTLWLQWRIANERAENTLSERQPQPNHSTIEFEATAVMVGKFVVTGRCSVIVSPQGTVEIRLNGGGSPQDTTLVIPGEELTSFSFSPPSPSGGIANEALVAMKTKPSGNIAKDPAHRQYDPSDKGVAGFITVFIVNGNDIHQHKKAVNEFFLGTRAGISVETISGGELPRILRRHLDQHTKDAGQARSRRTLRSGADYGTPAKVLFHYPPETSARDRIPIHIVDEARTEEGEFLNDSLVDLYLRHMHTEGYRTWDRSGQGPVQEAMDINRVHIFSSLFFKKLTEGGASCSPEESYLKVRGWARNVDIFSMKFVFVPVAEDMHWSLACLCNLDRLQASTDEDQDTDANVYDRRYVKDEERPCILSLDSLNMHHAGRIGFYLRRYLQAKWAEDNAQNIEFDDNVLPIVSPRVPTQSNGCDCGVYVLRYAKEICRSWISVTTADVSDRLKKHFSPNLFSPSDIRGERKELKELLRHCTKRNEEAIFEKQNTGEVPGETKGEAASTSSSDRPEQEYTTPMTRVEGAVGGVSSATAEEFPTWSETEKARTTELRECAQAESDPPLGTDPPDFRLAADGGFKVDRTDIIEAGRDLIDALYAGGYLVVDCSDTEEVVNPKQVAREEDLAAYWTDYVYGVDSTHSSSHSISEAKRRGCPVVILRAQHDSHVSIQTERSRLRVERLPGEYHIWKAGRDADSSVEDVMLRTC